MKGPKLMVVAGMLLVLTFVTSCGSSDSAETSLTKRQFVKRANAICDAAEREKMDRAATYLKKHPNAHQQKPIGAFLLPPLAKMIRKLEEVPPPKGDEPRVEAVIAAYEGVGELLEKHPQRFVSITPSPFKKADHMAVDYGLVGCDVSP